MATVLGIETSCDETAVAVYDRQRGLLSHCLFSQIDLHARYGGVVPELAARDHVRRLPGLVAQALDDAGLTLDAMDAIAYTAGPGLVGALLVGASCARGMACAADLPALGVHHMEGHLLAPLLETPAPSPPFVALLVSGGHTLLVGVARIGQYEVLGQSLDDAAGEAFDKTAKLLRLGYPGGPAIARLAEQGEPGRFTFTRPMCNRPGLDFSFSGLKTQVLTAWAESGGSDQERADVARGFEETVADTLRIKCERALRHTGYDKLIVAGGVGANLRLRARLADMAEKRGVRVYFPRHEFCTDNAAMIALAGELRLQQADRSLAIEVHPRWDLQSLPPVTAHG